MPRTGRSHWHPGHLPRPCRVAVAGDAIWRARRGETRRNNRLCSGVFGRTRGDRAARRHRDPLSAHARGARSRRRPAARRHGARTAFQQQRAGLHPGGRCVEPGRSADRLRRLRRCRGRPARTVGHPKDRRQRGRQCRRCRGTPPRAGRRPGRRPDALPRNTPPQRDPGRHKPRREPPWRTPDIVRPRRRRRGHVSRRGPPRRRRQRARRGPAEGPGPRNQAEAPGDAHGGRKTVGRRQTPGL